MGKRIITQARGKGSFTYRVKRRAFVYRIKYPNELKGEGTVLQLLNSPAHSAPLARIKYEKGTFYIPAFKGMTEGQKISFGGNEIKEGNILRLGDIPIKTFVYGIESKPGDGGVFIKAAGSFATVNRIIGNEVMLSMPSKKERGFHPDCRATIGIIAGSGKHPLAYEKENTLDNYFKLLENGIGKISHHFKNIWVRISDIRTDEFGSLTGAPGKEINPMLGFHGVRFSLKHPKILEAELKAIQSNAEKFPEKNFGVMFPQIISIEEVIEAKKYFNKFKNPNMQFGVMIETPASCWVIKEICEEGISFVSFGTNEN